MARPTTEKICTVCGEPFLPTGGRQLKCKRCGGKQRKKSGLEQAVHNVDAQGISYGKYMSTKHKEEKIMAEKHIEEVTTEPEQVQPEQDALQEYIDYLMCQMKELTERLERTRITLEEAAAYNSVRHSEWRQRQDSKNPCTGGNQ